MMNEQLTCDASMDEKSICCVCGLADAEVKVNPGSRLFHVRCLPPNIISKKTKNPTSISSIPSNTHQQENKDGISCPASCPSANNNGNCSLYFLPFKIESFPPLCTTTTEPSQSDRDKFMLSLSPVFPTQTLSDNSKEIVIDEDVQIRNGRWTAEEIKFVDVLMKRFNQGTLLLPNGGSLNNFLRSMLLCKGTRLRKKIKNANFCTRLYNKCEKHITDNTQANNEEQESLSSLQHSFLQSLDCEDDKNLLTFSLKRMWMTHFLNYCIQAGFESIVAADWIESLEAIESKVNALKSNTEKHRRLNHVSCVNVTNEPKDISPLPSHEDPSGNDDVLNDFGGSWDNLSVNDAPEFALPMPPPIVPFEIKKLDDLSVMSDVSDSFAQNEFGSKRKVVSMMGKCSSSSKRHKNLDALIKRTCSSNQTSKSCQEFGNWSPFVQKILQFIESNNLPFQYFDVWLATTPSSQEKSEQVLLRHVGHSALDDIESIWNLYHMNRFGEYSSTFAFSPGEGLPGRVIASGLPTWDDSIQKLSSHSFPRVQGARSHGVRKGLGIPMQHGSFGKVVVAMYSINDVPKDINLLQKCCAYFDLSVPRAKWELILDTDSNMKSAKLQIRDNDESAITDLLSRHCSIKPQFQQSLISLRLLLLKDPLKREDNDASAIQMIKASFRHYQKSSKDEEQIASLIVQEWNFIKSEHSKRFFGPLECSHRNSLQERAPPVKEKPIPLMHTNYAVS